MLQQPVDPIYDDDENDAGDDGHDWSWEMNQRSHACSPNWATFLNLRLSASIVLKYEGLDLGPHKRWGSPLPLNHILNPPFTFYFKSGSH